MAYRTQKTLKTLALAGTAMSLIAFGPAAAQATKKIEFDIEAQELGDALNEFGVQSGKEVYYLEADIAGKQTKGVEGVYSADEAINLLLNSTGIPHSDNGSGTILIGEAYIQRASLDEETTPQPFRVAQVDQENDVRGINEPDENNEEARQDVIVVTGTSIRGVNPDSSPVSIFSRDDIDALGVTNVEQLLARIPQNFQELNPVATGAAGPTNDEAATGVDLRGLGVGSTLVLINGRRIAPTGGRTPDTSMIPLSALARVEVLSDGASSIYGADAVGGVVNFVLIDDFDGLETTIDYGGATQGGLRSINVGQTVGRNWGSGNLLGSYNYSDTSRLLASDRSFSSSAGSNFLYPDETVHSLLITGQQDVGEKATVFADVLLTSREVDTATESFNGVTQSNENENFQVFSTLGARVDLSSDITAEVLGSFSQLETDTTRTILLPTATAPDIIDRTTTTSVFDLEAKLDGSTGIAVGDDIMFALGGGYRTEEFSRTNEDDRERETLFAYGELFVPLIAPSNDSSFAHRLELNISARYDDFSDFGDAFNPKIGVLWAPKSELSFRGTYSKSLRAPTLTQLSSSGNSYLFYTPSVFFQPDPFSDDGSTVRLLTQGPANANLTEEEASVYTVGFDAKPSFVPGLTISATYFNIDYTDRIGLGDPTQGFASLVATPELFPDLYNLSPTISDIESAINGSVFLGDFTGQGISPTNAQEILAAIDIIYDNRIRNLQSSKLDGMDFELGFNRSFNEVEFSAGLAGTYIFDFVERTSRLAPEITAVDTVANPANLRGRLFAGLHKDAWRTQVNVNYTDGYENPFSAAQSDVDSWTTIDLTGSYEFIKENAGLLKGTEISISIQNVFDSDPPFVVVGDARNTGIFVPIGFDPTNANPFGRVLNVGIRKRW